MQNKKLSIWEKIIAEKNSEHWLEKLAWAGSQNCVITTLTAGKRAKLHLYGQSPKTLKLLVKNHGGKWIQTSLPHWIEPSNRTILLPISPILCVSSEEHLPKKWQHLPHLWIPVGMAFGTGDHATTAMCLRQLLLRSKGEKKRILDLGTGSGILALACAMQGHQVEALDFDPECIRTAKLNSTRNSYQGTVSWIQGDIAAWEPKKMNVDLIVANIYSTLLISTLPKMQRWIKPGGTIILSGILVSQKVEVMRELERLKFELLLVLKKGKWLCLVVKK